MRIQMPPSERACRLVEAHNAWQADFSVGMEMLDKFKFLRAGGLIVAGAIQFGNYVRHQTGFIHDYVAMPLQKEFPLEEHGGKMLNVARAMVKQAKEHPS